MTDIASETFARDDDLGTRVRYFRAAPDCVFPG
jgi:hypothetical protein